MGETVLGRCCRGRRVPICWTSRLDVAAEDAEFVVARFPDFLRQCGGLPADGGAVVTKGVGVAGECSPQLAAVDVFEFELGVRGLQVCEGGGEVRRGGTGSIALGVGVRSRYLVDGMDV